MCSNNEYLKQNYGCISNTNTNTSELNFQNTNTNTNTPTLVFKYSINTNTLYLTPSLLTIDPAYPYLGATPDGMATCDCCGQRIMEIKCPFKTRQYHPTSDHAMQNSHFLKRDANGSVSLSSNHEYYTQIQGQLLLCHQTKCDFIVWTTNGIHIETIHSDKPLQAKIVSQCKDFFVCYVLPEQITHKLQDNEKPMTNVEIYCICGRGEDGYMIACDNPTCPYQWFHFSCIGMESKPNGSWFCDRCKLLQ